MSIDVAGSFSSSDGGEDGTTEEGISVIYIEGHVNLSRSGIIGPIVALPATKLYDSTTTTAATTTTTINTTTTTTTTTTTATPFDSECSPEEVIIKRPIFFDVPMSLVCLSRCDYVYLV